MAKKINKKQILMDMINNGTPITSIHFYPIPGPNDLGMVALNKVENPIFVKFTKTTFEISNNPTYYNKGYFSRIVAINDQRLD